MTPKLSLLYQASAVSGFSANAKPRQRLVLLKVNSRLLMKLQKEAEFSL